MNVLDGKIAIVTGSGTGLGRGIAQELAEAGASLAVVEIDADSARAAAEELAGTGVESRAYPADVADSKQVDDAFAAVVRDFGRLDIVVNNAGISRVGPHTHEVTDEDWHDSIAVMQSGVFFCMRAAGRIMIPQRSGSILNISSIRGFSPNPGRMTVLRTQGRGDHDDDRRGGGMGRARDPRQRDRPGGSPDSDVGYGRRARRDRRAVLHRHGSHASSRLAVRGGQARRLSLPPTTRRTSPEGSTRSTAHSPRSRPDEARGLERQVAG